MAETTGLLNRRTEQLVPRVRISSSPRYTERMQMLHLGAASVVNDGCQCKACFSTGSFIYGLRRSPRLCASRAQNRRFHARSSLCAVSRAQNRSLHARNPRWTVSRAQNRLLHARNPRWTALALTHAHRNAILCAAAAQVSRGACGALAEGGMADPWPPMAS